MQDAPSLVGAPPAGGATQLKLSAEVDRGPGASQRVAIVVEGQGPLAEQVAAEVAELFKRAVARALDATAAPLPAPLPAPIRAAVVEPLPAAQSVQHLDQQPERVVQAVAAPVPAPVPAPALPAAPKPTPWFQQHRSRISLSIGVFLFALAVLVPLLVPPEMRREILPMPIALGLVGALSLFSGLMPEPDRSNKGAHRNAADKKPAEAVTPTTTAPRPRAAVPAAYAKAPSTATRTFGTVFGAVFAIAGLAAPLALPDVTADERFVMMLGFAPIALVGAFLMWVFLRRPAAKSVTQSAPGNRAARPQGSGAAAIAPGLAAPGLTPGLTPGAMSRSTGALVALGVILGVVVLLVILATVLPLLNAQP